MKEFWKSVNILESYGQKFGVLFFWDTVYMVSWTLMNLSPKRYFGRKTCSKWPRLCDACDIGLKFALKVQAPDNEVATTEHILHVYR